MCARAWTDVPRRTTRRCPTLASDVCAFTCNVCTSVDGCTPAYDKALPDISRRCAVCSVGLVNYTHPRAGGRVMQGQCRSCGCGMTTWIRKDSLVAVHIKHELQLLCPPDQLQRGIGRAGKKTRSSWWRKDRMTTEHVIIVGPSLSIIL